MKNRPLYFLAISILIFFGITGYHFLTGWPPIIMMLLAMLTGLVLLGLFYVFFRWLGSPIQKVPLVYRLAVLSTFASLISLKLFGFGWPNSVYYVVICILILFLTSIFWYAQQKSWLAFGVLFLSTIGVVAALYFFIQPGNDPFAEKRMTAKDYYDVPIGLPELENPGALGRYKVQQFTYGSGIDQQRKEFSDGVLYRTPTVNASLLLPEWKGKKKKWRERYWGFGADAFPLNGRVYMPAGEGPFPLTLIVHGNHSMIDYSDDGYGYLGNLLASKGIIAVSVDENFINGHWSGDFMGKEMPVRAWLLLKHLEQWKSWNTSNEHPLKAKVDMDNIMLIGHSRGGEAVAIAGEFNKLPYYPDRAEVKFNFNFGIRGIVSLAPTDYRYDRKMVLENVDYLSLQGSYDADETSFWGMRPFRRMVFNDSVVHFKAGIYLHGANHGQFNSTWGRSDFGAPRKWLLNLAPLMPKEDQENTAKVFIGAFAEAVLKDNPDYIPLFKQVAWGKKWLPESYILSQFAPSELEVWADFEEDLDLTTAKDSLQWLGQNLVLWRELNLKTRDNDFRDNNAVVLGWDDDQLTTPEKSGIYELSPTTGLLPIKDVNGELQFTVGAGDPNWLKMDSGDHDDKKENKEESKYEKEPMPDFSIQLIDSLGQSSKITISDFKKVAPRLLTRFTKLNFLDKEWAGDAWEVQLQSFHIPLKTFKDHNPILQLSQLQKLRFIFDKTPKGVVVLDEVGYVPSE